MTPIETCINNLCNEPVLYVLQAHPKLHQSLQTIVAQRVQLPSKKEELLGNFKLSVRGSIRKPPNVVLDSQLLTTFHFAFPVQLVDASLFVRPVYLASLLLRTWISSILQLQSLDSTLDVAQFVACLKFIVCLQKLLDQIHEEHGPVPETSTTAPDAVPATANADPPADASGPGTSGPGEGSNRRKRKNENTPASTKRPKVDRAKITPTADI